MKFRVERDALATAVAALAGLMWPVMAAIGATRVRVGVAPQAGGCAVARSGVGASAGQAYVDCSGRDRGLVGPR